MNALGKLVLYPAFFGVGLLVLTLMDGGDKDINSDFAILIGCVVSAWIIGIVFLVTHLVKSKRKKHDKTTMNTDDDTPPEFSD